MRGSAAAPGADRSAGVKGLLRAVRVLRSGGLVVAPTDTQLGLLADPFRPGALRRLVAVKGRRRGEPFPLLVADEAALVRLVRVVPPRARRLIAAFWPGPLTLLLPARRGLPRAVVGPRGLVAVRRPGPSPAARIVRRFGGPLVATSANPRRVPPPPATDLLDPRVVAAVDLIVPGRARHAEPSTIVRCGARGYRVVRAGVVPDSAIRAALGKA